MQESLLTLEDCARRMKVSKRHVQALIASHRFGPKVLTPGRVVRILESEFTAWLTAGAPSREQWLEQQRGGLK